MVMVEMVFYVGIKYVLISLFSKGMLTLEDNHYSLHMSIEILLAILKDQFK